MQYIEILVKTGWIYHLLKRRSKKTLKWLNQHFQIYQKQNNIISEYSFKWKHYRKNSCDSRLKGTTFMKFQKFWGNSISVPIVRKYLIFFGVKIYHHITKIL